MATNPVRVGIVGCGEVAQIIHLPTLATMPDRFRVAALCDASPAVLNGVGDAWNIRPRFRDYADLVRSAEVDAVLVTNPHVLHAPTALAAMQAGKHVLIEKPMCLSLAEADALAEARARAGVVAQIGYMRRHAAAFLAAKPRVAAMTGIRLARVHDIIGRNALIIGETGLRVIRPTDLPPASAAALLRAQSDGVARAIGPCPPALEAAYLMLLGLSSHDLSAMRELLGPPQSVLHAACRGTDGRCITASFDYGSFVCQFETFVDLIPRFDAHIEIHSAEEMIRIDWDTPYVRNLPGRLTILIPEHRAVSTGWSDAFHTEWRAFHASITTGAPVKTTPEDAREDLVLFGRMMEKMRESQGK